MPLKGVHIKRRSAEGVSGVDTDLERALNVWEMIRMNGLLSELFHHLILFTYFSKRASGMRDLCHFVVDSLHDEISTFTPLVE